ncbi:glycoside hydrolase family 43 protein [Portibacter lacus]|uniref:Alpha-N-arabinofuranosidase n=1 Tax=Portibacter lacus TaxID=1099794 RepID=A0AA37WGB0_9BACT|nr:glycoside hydrolase family 43 protein [Portibacter lacus]GLR19527.1 alpha-N-arabinofuranosidase [Portibacter lacus]
MGNEKIRHLVKHIYTADPSAHVFNNKIYIYPSHDIDAGIPFNDNGDHFGMQDYHVFSMEAIDGEVIDHGNALDVADVPWAKRQMWAPDAATRDGKYYLYFPAKDENDIFYIGVAIGDRPEGPFIPEAKPIEGSFSIDPAVFLDPKSGSHYLYFGGLWGGQLQRYKTGKYEEDDSEPNDHAPALCAKVAKLKDDMLSLDEEVKDLLIVDKFGNPLKAGDHNRRFFEAAWMHVYNGTYYFSYSTGNTHLLCYATGDNPYGPFTYRGVIMTPVVGWTTHHSICEFEGKWYLFHHDSKLSGGVTHLRSIKIAEIKYREDGSIETLDGMME